MKVLELFEDVNNTVTVTPQADNKFLVATKATLVRSFVQFTTYTKTLPLRRV